MKLKCDIVHAIIDSTLIKKKMVKSCHLKKKFELTLSDFKKDFTINYLLLFKKST